MKQLAKNDFLNIKSWIYRNARPVDLSRWQFHFENGSREAVLCALSSYQNSDGGFGHALEADSWNPFSSPLQTSTAISILREVACYNEEAPIINNLLSFLENSPSFEKRGWVQKVPSNNDFPHAPWWAFDKDKTGGFNSEWEYNPTAALAGFSLRVLKNKNAKFYETCLRITNEAIKKLLSADSMEPHELGCFCILFSDLKKSETADNFDLDAMEQKLQKLVCRAIEFDTTKWNGYVTKPSSFIDSPDNIFYCENKSIMDYELDNIIDSRNKDGIWNIIWTWGAYDKEFAISENWWKANMIIINLILLKNFGRMVL
jgi:hypothetical protein